MKTYQDWLEVAEGSDREKIEFMKTAINDYKSSDTYKKAIIAKEYAEKRNLTIIQYEKLLFTLTGQAVPDAISANYKLRSGHFNRFISQENQYLLSNGVSWNNEDTSKKLGTKKADFDTRLQKAGRYALIGACSFGFWNFDHLDVFAAWEFVPLYDEEDGALKAGIRFWQIADNKPLRATMYEISGYQNAMWNKKTGDTNDYEGKFIDEKQSYIVKVRESEADGEEIYDYQNYPTFPIVPLWGNFDHQTELEGRREQIDAYDLIKSGFCNNVDDASIIYWLIENAGGMQDTDIVKFIDRIKTVHGFVMDDEGATATPHTIDMPFEGREKLLELLDRDLIKDFMAFDAERIASGAVTATQIEAAYELLDEKVNDYEACIIDFINEILVLAGIDDKPTFNRSRVVNATEMINTIVSSGSYLSSEYVTEKILSILGDKDKLDTVLAQMDEGELKRFEVSVNRNNPIASTALLNNE